jgi:hypothetical protein
MRNELKTITPRYAAEVLATLNPDNRNVRKWWVNSLARAITENRWRITHQGIAFNCDGTLIDGQHRLLAIVLANKPVQMYVASGMAKDAVFGIDQGISRDARDLSGSLGTGTKLANTELAVGRAMICGLEPNNFRVARMNLSTEELMKFVIVHRAAIAWTISSTPGNIVHVAPPRAAIARAYYHENRDMLSRFCEVYSTGISQEKNEVAAALLREYVARTRASGAAGRADMYGKTEGAIGMFCSRKIPVRLQCVAKERYQLPKMEA